MKNKTYRFLTLLTTASMLFSGMPVNAAGPEADGNGETVTEGDYELYVIDDMAKTASISKYNGTGSGALTIPDKLGEYSIVGLGSNSFKSTGFNSVTIPATITEMGSYAFAECSELRSVEFAGGGSAITLKDHTFANCDKLQSIRLSGRVTEIPESFAYDCDLLTTVEWPAGLTTIGARAFNGDEMLTSSDLTGTALTSINDGAFCGCKALPLVKLPGNTTLTIGDNAFKETKMSGGTLVIPANVTSLGSYAFDECSELQSVEFAAGSSTIALKDHTFKDCDKLQRISLSERVKEIPESFAYDCDLLTTVEWPAGLTTIGATAFNGNDMLTSSDLSGTALTSIKDSAFSGCKALPLVKLPVNATLTIGDNAFKQTKMNGGTLEIPANVASLGSYAFAECSELQSVEFAAGGTTIALKDHTFKDCDKLQSISLSERVTAIPASFAYDCDLLTTVEWPAGLTTIGATAFNGSDLLTSSDLSGTALTSIGDSAFSGCTTLPLVKLPTNTTALTIGSNAFEDTKMDGEGGLVIPANVASLGSYAFSDCDGLQSVVFEADEEGSTTISLKDHTFSDCDGLQTITFSSRVVTIPAYFAFGCPKLVQLVDGTAVETVPESGAFTTSKISEIVLTGCNLELEDYSWSKDNREKVDVAVSVSLEEEYTVEEGKTLDLKPVYTIVPEGSKLPDLTWESSSTSNVKITGNGVVKGIKEGTAYVTVTRQMAFEDEDIEKGKVKINVVKKSSGPAKEPEPFIMVAGGNGATDPQPLVMESTTDLVLIKGQKFVLGNKDWKVNAEGKSFISASKGNIKVKKGGTGAVLSRDTLGGGTQSIAVTVLAPVITKAEKTLKLEAGQQGQLSFSGTTAKAGSISFTEDNLEVPIRFYTASPDVALVDESGNVTAIAKGTATITAYIYGVAFKFKVKVTETSPAAKRFLHLNVGKSKSIKIKGLKKTVWNQVAGEEGVVDIIKGSKIKALDKTGTVILQCEDYQLYVVVEDPSIVGGDKPYSTTLTLTKGTASQVQLKSIADPSNVYFKSNKSHIAYCDENGYIHARGTGKAKLTAKINGKTVTVNVIVQ